MIYAMEEYKNYFEYLDELRESGVTNMFGAAPYVQKAFGIEDKEEAREIVQAWMKTFNTESAEFRAKNFIAKQGAV